VPGVRKESASPSRLSPTDRRRRARECPGARDRHRTDERREIIYSASRGSYRCIDVRDRRRPVSGHGGDSVEVISAEAMDGGRAADLEVRNGEERKRERERERDSEKESARSEPLPTMAIGSGYGDRQGEPKCTRARARACACARGIQYAINIRGFDVFNSNVVV